MFIRFLATLFEVVTMLAAPLGFFMLVAGLLPGNSAIQTAATSATAVAFVAIPYAVAGIFHRYATRELLVEAARRDRKPQ